MKHCLQSKKQDNVSSDNKNKNKSLMNLKEPNRMIRLAIALMEGGNERVASRMKDIAKMDIDTVCKLIVEELKANESPDNETPNSNRDIFIFLTNQHGICAALVDLLIELIFLLPLNVDQILSRSLWMFFQEALVPLIDTLANAELMEEQTALYCGELIAIFEMVLTAMTRLGMFKLAMENQAKVRRLLPFPFLFLFFFTIFDYIFLLYMYRVMLSVK